MLTESPGSEVDELGLSEGGEGGDGEGEAGRGEGPGEVCLREVGDEREDEEEGERSRYLGSSHLAELAGWQSLSHCANFGLLLHL